MSQILRYEAGSNVPNVLMTDNVSMTDTVWVLIANPRIFISSIMRWRQTGTYEAVYAAIE